MDTPQNTNNTAKPKRKQSNVKQKHLACNHCNRIFARLEHLQRHIRTHTKEKPFVCEICTKTFARSDLLVRHERLVHPGDENNHTSRKTHKPRRSSTASKSNNATQDQSALSLQAQTSPSISDPLDMVQQHNQPLLSPPIVHENRNMMDMLDPALMQPSNGMHHLDSMGPQQPQMLGAPQLDPSWGYDLNLLSHAASHVASNGQTQFDIPGISQVTQEELQEPLQQMIPTISEPQYQPRMLTEGYGSSTPMFEAPDLGDPMQDFTVFLDSVGLSSDWHSGIFNPDQNDALITPELRNENMARMNGEEGKLGVPEEPSTFSRFGSRLPSLQPEPRDPDMERPIPRSIDPTPAIPMKTNWEVSDSDRQQFASKLASFDSVMPKGFIPPSRHSLSRYIAGYINGFHEHLPFIHVPTLSVATSAPELVLALAAVGAQYRFENSRGIELFHAAKAVVLEQIRRRDGFAMPQSWDRPRTGSISRSPGGFQGLSTFTSPFHNMTNDHAVVDDGRDLLDSVQSLLLLTAFATWERQQELLREALSFQSTLARLVREMGLANPDIVQSPEDLAWEDWIKLEGEKRTKLIVFCFFNLHSVTWNVPPLILNAEINLDLPDSGNEWKAGTADEWKRLHLDNTNPPMPFQDTFANLFSKPPVTPSQPVSPLGNYVLIHALIQQIFFARQLSLIWPGAAGGNLRNEDIIVLERGLSAWKTSWKRAPESSLDPQNPNGPVAFTSTALLGLAYIRLHVDMGPLRHLETRHPTQIATALYNTPPIRRDPRLTPALLHSAHALSIPVRLGIDFVAKTQTFFWSIQHSLCSLECAFLLSKWLYALSRVVPEGGAPLSEHERKLLMWVRSLLEETEREDPSIIPILKHDLSSTNNTLSSASPAQDKAHVSQSQADRERDAQVLMDDWKRVRRLSVAVVRVWSKTFKGNTSWAIVDIIGSALELYADMCEADFGE